MALPNNRLGRTAPIPAAAKLASARRLNAQPVPFDAVGLGTAALLDEDDDAPAIIDNGDETGEEGDAPEATSSQDVHVGKRPLTLSFDAFDFTKKEEEQYAPVNIQTLDAIQTNAAYQQAAKHVNDMLANNDTDVVFMPTAPDRTGKRALMAYKVKPELTVATGFRLFSISGGIEGDLLEPVSQGALMVQLQREAQSEHGTKGIFKRLDLQAFAKGLKRMTHKVTGEAYLLYTKGD